MAIPRMRTVKDCIVMIKGEDSGSAVTEYFVRQLCKTGKVKSFSTGKKVLVDLDNLLSFLGNDTLSS
ncbi:MAG: hypothetical protein RR327_03685 [Clostridia bacterium]